MKTSNTAAVSQALARLSVNGLAAAIGAVAALAARVALSFDYLPGPGLQSSYARQRRGRAG